MTRRVPVPLVVLALLAALLLGSVGSATAAGLSTKAVKKIAAKVVKKKASGLSVANAANAATLAGQPASAYQDGARVFTVAVPASTSVIEVPLPLGAGASYLVSYSANLYPSAFSNSAVNAGCLVGVQGPTAVPGGYSFVTADSAAQGAATFSSFSASGVVTLRAGERAELSCTSGRPFVTLGEEPIQVVVVQLDSVAEARLSAS